MRSYLSMTHLSVAALFARQAWQIEQTHAAATCTEEKLAEHQGYVIGAVFMAAAFLEANISELFCDAGDPHPNPTSGLNTQSTLMTQLWAMGIPRTARYPILEKYDIALALAGQPRFDTNAASYPGVSRMIRLRNALIHFEPE